MSVAVGHKLPGDPEFITPQMRYSRCDAEILDSLEIASVVSHLVRKGYVPEKAYGDGF